MCWFWLLGGSRGEMETLARHDAEQTLVWKGYRLSLSCSFLAESISCYAFSLLSIVQSWKTSNQKNSLLG